MCCISLLSFESFDSFSLSYIYSCIRSVIVSMVMSLFRIFFFNSQSPLDLPIRDRNFEAISSAAGVTFSNTQFFSVSRRLHLFIFCLLLFRKIRLDYETCYVLEYNVVRRVNIIEVYPFYLDRCLEPSVSSQ